MPLAVSLAVPLAVPLAVSRLRRLPSWLASNGMTAATAASAAGGRQAVGGKRSGQKRPPLAGSAAGASGAFGRLGSGCGRAAGDGCGLGRRHIVAVVVGEARPWFVVGVVARRRAWSPGFVAVGCSRAVLGPDRRRAPPCAYAPPFRVGRSPPPYRPCARARLPRRRRPHAPSPSVLASPPPPRGRTPPAAAVAKEPAP